MSHVTDIFAIKGNMEKEINRDQARKKGSKLSPIIFHHKNIKQKNHRCETACYERFHNKRKLTHTRYDFRD